MSEFKGTPGPWKWESKYFGLRQTTEAGGKWILQPEPWEGMHMAYPSATRAANARLIAAAPELLEALRNLELGANTVDGCYTRNPGNFAGALRDLREYAEAARAAIAKATGEAQ